MSDQNARAEYEQLKEEYNQKARELWVLRRNLARSKFALVRRDVAEETRLRDRKILEMREEQAMTLQEIGNELGITRERVRQLLVVAKQRRSGTTQDQFPGLSIDDLIVK